MSTINWTDLDDSKARQIREKLKRDAILRSLLQQPSRVVAEPEVDQEEVRDVVPPPVPLPQEQEQKSGGQPPKRQKPGRKPFSLLRLIAYTVTTILALLAIYAIVGSVINWAKDRGITPQGISLKYWAIRGYNIPAGEHELVLWNGGNVWYISDNGCVPVWAAFTPSTTDPGKFAPILPPLAWEADQATELLSANRDGCLGNPRNLQLFGRWKDSTWAIVSNPIVENPEPDNLAHYRLVWVDASWVGIKASNLAENTGDIAKKMDMVWDLKTNTDYGKGVIAATSSTTATAEPTPTAQQPTQRPGCTSNCGNEGQSSGSGGQQPATQAPEATATELASPLPTYPALDNGNLQVRPEVPAPPATPIPTVEPTWAAATMVPVPTQAQYQPTEFAEPSKGDTCLFVGCLAGHPAAPAATANAAADAHAKQCHALFWQYHDAPAGATIPPGDQAMIDQCQREGLYQ